MSVLGYSALNKVKKNLDAEFGTAAKPETTSIISTITYEDLNGGKNIEVDLGALPEKSVLIHSQINVTIPFLTSSSSTPLFSLGLGTQEEQDEIEFPVEKDFRLLIFDSLPLNNSGIFEYQGSLNGTEDKTLNNFLNSISARFHILGAWSTGGNLSTQRYTCAGAGTQVAGLAISGRYTNELSSCEEYNGASWSAGGSTSTARRGPGGAGTQIAALTFGGYDSPTYYSSSEEYNGTAWSAGGSLNSTKRYPGGCGYQYSALCVGGVDLSGTYSETEEYDGATWTLSGQMITARHYLGATGYLSVATSFGGQLNSTNDDSNITEEYNGLLWATANNMPTSISAIGANGSANSAMSSGGEFDGVPYSYTFAYDGTNWTTTNELSVSRRTCAACGPQTSALSFGGLDTGGSIKNTTEEFSVTSLSYLDQGSLDLHITYTHR